MKRAIYTKTSRPHLTAQHQLNALDRGRIPEGMIRLDRSNALYGANTEAVFELRHLVF
jgi:hypothetical protein